MPENRFDVIVSTPIGDMDGSATMDIDGTSLTGVLRMMGKDNPISEGTMDADGNFSFSGRMKLPIGSLGYTISGKLEDGKIDAVCQTKMGEMKVRSK